MKGQWKKGKKKERWEVIGQQKVRWLVGAESRHNGHRWPALIVRVSECVCVLVCVLVCVWECCPSYHTHTHTLYRVSSSSFYRVLCCASVRTTTGPALAVVIHRRRKKIVPQFQKMKRMNENEWERERERDPLRPIFIFVVVQNCDHFPIHYEQLGGRREIIQIRRKKNGCRSTNLSIIELSQTDRKKESS